MMTINVPPHFLLPMGCIIWICATNINQCKSSMECIRFIHVGSSNTQVLDASYGYYNKGIQARLEGA